MAEIVDQAPDFEGNGYPGTGEKIGPAWRAMWSAMADGEWRSSVSLASVACEAAPVVTGTALNLLHSAARCGVIEKRTGPHPTRKGARLASYRRPAGR